MVPLAERGGGAPPLSSVSLGDLTSIDTPASPERPIAERQHILVASSPQQRLESSCVYKSNEACRAAFLSNDVEASRLEHRKPIDTHRVSRTDPAEYVKVIVFGGLDGIMTTFAAIAAAAGGGDSAFHTIVVFGFANLIPNAFCLGWGELVSGYARLDHRRTAHAREVALLGSQRAREVENLKELYKAKRGMTHTDADLYVETLAQVDELLVESMMFDKLGLVEDLDDFWEPTRQGVVMMCAFAVFGTLPLIGYLVLEIHVAFLVACGMSAAALLLLGALKGYLTGMNIPKSALLMLVNGTISGGTSFVLSVAVAHWVESQL